MKYREVADYADGRESAISGRDADDAYSPLDSLAAVGAAPVFFGDVDQQLLGDATTWDRVAVVKYPTRKAFIDMQSLRVSRSRITTRTLGWSRRSSWARNPWRCRRPRKGSSRPTGLTCPTRRPPMTARSWWSMSCAFMTTRKEQRRPKGHPIRWSNIRPRRPRLRSVTVFGSVAGSPSKTRSSAMVGHGIRSVSTSSRARQRSWPSSWTRSASKLKKDHREAAIADTYTMIVRARLNELEASIDS